MPELTIENGWTSLGRVSLTAEKLSAPQNIPDQAGLYCLKFDDKTRYFGEAGDLRRRIGDYMIYYAASGIESEFRINRALIKFKGAELLIATGELLASRSQRCVVESRLIKEAKGQNLTVLNGGSLPDRIAFHASEIIRLSAKISLQSTTPGVSND